MTGARIQTAGTRQKELLVAIAVRWLSRVDDEVAAGQTEDELAEQAAAFIDSSDWHREVASQC